MKKRQIIILSISFTIVAGAVVLSMFLSGQKDPPKKARIIPAKKYVQTTVVEYKDIQTNVEAYGRVETAQSLDLVSEVAGRMYRGSVALKEGTRFSKGALLFKIDATEAELNLKSQKSNFLKDLAAIMPDLNLDFNGDYQKWVEFYEKVDINDPLPKLPGNITEKEKTFLATKGIFTSYYTIQSAEVRLKKYNYYAPFDGSIIEVTQESGAFINPGVKIGRIIRSGLHELKVSVDTRDIPWIREGAETSVFSEETQQKWTGVVTRISDFVNLNTQSVDVYIAIRPSEDRIYDGQFLQASIPAEVIKDGMVIPRNAIYNGNEVFVLEDTLLKRKEINIHRMSENMAIFSGLEEGSEMVSEPLINAHNNMVAFKLEEDKDINMEKKESKVAANASSPNTGSK